MSGEHTWTDTLEDTLRALDPASRRQDPSETLRPSLGAVDGASLAPLPDGLGELGELIGEGGMGQVRLAEQRRLERTVAVKSLKPEVISERAIRSLLNEAVIAGLLEHPNVLPVHDIVLDEAGHPHIVMKRVEGEPWSRLARDPAAIRERHGARDALAWNLDVLLSVCNAIAYAHDRGILHRDLKLDNVMIGRFGEVVVLDWGVAVALDDRYGERLPLARAQRRLAGTPRMMAPEMARADGPALGPWTDVYLLGGMLYQVLTGRSPHRGDDIREVLQGIPGFVPTLPAGVPAALRRILERALAIEPGDRFADVAAFAEAIRAFVEHRGSVRLAARARSSLDALQRAATPDAVRAELSRLYDQARFGFEQALAEWPENSLAREGLREARLSLGTWEIRHGEPGTAAALFESVDRVPEALLRELHEALGRRRAAREELEARREDADPTIGQRTRVFVIGLVGLLWFLGPLAFIPVLDSLAWWHLHGVSLGLFAIVLGLAVWARDSLSRTALNRASTATMLLVPVSQIAFDLGASGLDLAPTDALLLRPALWGTLFALYALISLRSAWLVALLYGTLAAVAGLLPPWISLVLVAGCNAVLIAALAIRWWSPDLIRGRQRPVPTEET